MITSGDYNTINQNHVFNNRGSGIIMIDAAIRNTIKNNDLFQNRVAGIMTTGSNQLNTFYSNSIYNNNAGINISGKSNIIYHNWNITYNTNGIILNQATNCSIYQNIISRNIKRGIRILNSSMIQSYRNTVTSNNLGVIVTNSDIINMTKNNIYSNAINNYFESQLSAGPSPIIGGEVHEYRYSGLEFPASVIIQTRLLIG